MFGINNERNFFYLENSLFLNFLKNGTSSFYVFQKPSLLALE